jgi:hypothetical protein
MLTKPEHIAFREEWLAKRRAQFHESQRDSLTLRELLRNQCNELAEKFAEHFPDLTAQPGFYEGQEHIWCKDSEGNIVDPTYEQFRPGGRYEEYDENFHEICVGRCPNCGNHIYDLKKNARDFCDKECETSYRAYITAEAARW